MSVCGDVSWSRRGLPPWVRGFTRLGRGPNAASEKRFVAALLKSIAANRGVDESQAVVTEVAAAQWDRKTRDFRNAGFGLRDSECRASLTLIVTWGLDG